MLDPESHKFLLDFLITINLLVSLSCPELEYCKQYTTIMLYRAEICHSLLPDAVLKRRKFTELALIGYDVFTSLYCLRFFFGLNFVLFLFRKAFSLLQGGGECLGESGGTARPTGAKGSHPKPIQRHRTLSY